jgi:hypothetical protein
MRDFARTVVRRRSPVFACIGVSIASGHRPPSARWLASLFARRATILKFAPAIPPASTYLHRAGNDGHSHTSHFHLHPLTATVMAVSVAVSAIAMRQWSLGLPKTAVTSASRLLRGSSCVAIR